MNYCQECGGFILQIGGGGCGENGSLHRCTNCGQVYRQKTGGIIATFGGETFEPLDDMKTKLWCKDLPTVEVWRQQIVEDSKKPWSLR